MTTRRLQLGKCRQSKIPLAHIASHATITAMETRLRFAAPPCVVALTLSVCLLPACGAVRDVTAVGHDSRIDLRWAPEKGGSVVGYNVHRANDADGPFVRLNDRPHRTHLYSDFSGFNGRTYHYRVAAVDARGREAKRSPVVSAQSRAMRDDELLTSVQEATFRYFWDWGHPDSGLARERTSSRDVCTSGGTGFGLMAIMVGAERKFVPRAAAAARVLKIVAFLQDKAQRYHGAWGHWIQGETGLTLPFARRGDVHDDGADLVETAFLVQGMLAVRQYFDRDDPVEREIRRRITQVWREVEWDWFLGWSEGAKKLSWHWSPEHGWGMGLRIGGRFNESMITYLLAVASPTHPIPASCYHEGWIGSEETYADGSTYYGHKQWVGRPMGGPLFFTHYSFVGFDPRNKRDRFCNYFENNRNITRIHRAYCIENPGKHKGYGKLVWGLTASDTPGGYRAHAPGRQDNGTISPTAAISAMPYTPAESIATLKHFYHAYGKRLWGEFGFRDAFNLDHDWFASSYLAIDQGPIVCMIENHRTGLCWRMFMANPEIKPMLKKIGWTTDKAEK